MEKLCMLLLTLAALLPHCKTTSDPIVLEPPRGRPDTRCPQYFLGFPSRHYCQCDDDCPPNHKCCEVYQWTSWGVCLPAAFLNMAVCPKPQRYGLCAELCLDDSSCKSGDKCCSNGCGHQCTKPHIVKPGRCGTQQATSVCAELCSHDGECPWYLKCCPTNCGHTCSQPC